MSRVFLLSSNITRDPYPVYPLGMALIAAALSQAGHEVRQFDNLVAGQSREALSEALHAFAPDYVCLSLRNIDNVDSFSGEGGWYLAEARELVHFVRGLCPVPVIVGGPGFSIMPQEILAYLGADHGVAGEGEKVVCELVAALDAGELPPALVTGESLPLEAQGMTSPLLEQEFVEFYLRESGMVNLQTKRGCPNRCSYCTYPALEGGAFRPRDPEAVVDDIARMQRDHGIGSVFFTDSVFNDAAGHYLDVAEALARRNLGVKWCGFFRPQGIGRPELSLLKRSGLYAIELGTDAGCDATLAGFEKGFTFEEVVRVHEATVAERVPCSHFIMFGGPGETRETVLEGIANIGRLEHGVVFAFSGIRILPGTGMHQRAIDDGVIAADAPLLKPAYYFSPQVDPDWMNATLEKAFLGKKDRIFPPSKGQERMAVMHRFGFRGILWDQLVTFPGEGRRVRGGKG